MNKIVTLSVITAVALSTNSVFADTASTKYAGFQFATTTYTEDGISEEFNPTAIVARFGANVSDNFSIEGRLGTGVRNDTVNVAGMYDVKMEIDRLVGVYGVGHINFNKSSSVYGLFGFSEAKATFSSPSSPELGSVSHDDTGFSFGVGADFGIGNDVVALNIEYVQYLNKSDFDVSALSFGVKIALR